MSTAVAKDPDMLGALIAAGADVNARDRDGNTALALAARKGSSSDSQDDNTTAVVKALLDHGADPNLRNPAGESAATLAVSMSLPDEVKARIAAAAARFGKTLVSDPAP